jgi:hypothetical protein
MSGIAILESVRDDSATGVARAFVRHVGEDQRNVAVTINAALRTKQKGPAISPSLFDDA